MTISELYISVVVFRSAWFKIGYHVLASTAVIEADQMSAKLTRDISRPWKAHDTFST